MAENKTEWIYCSMNTIYTLEGGDNKQNKQVKFTVIRR